MPSNGSTHLLLVQFKQHYNRKKCRLQRDSNSDRKNRRQGNWPLVHCQCPKSCIQGCCDVIGINWHLLSAMNSNLKESIRRICDIFNIGFVQENFDVNVIGWWTESLTYVELWLVTNLFNLLHKLGSSYLHEVRRRKGDSFGKNILFGNTWVQSTKQCGNVAIQISISIRNFHDVETFHQIHPGRQ